MAEPLSRESIVAATRRLIQSEGLDAVSLRRIAATLGVTAPALYAYVEDKQDLLRAVAESQFERLIAELERIDEPDPIARIRRFSRVYVEHALANPELFRTMFLFPPELSVADATGNELPAATKAFETAYQAAAEAVERGLLRRDDPLMVALTLWTGVHG
ncbi:MAG: TetR/AcrR family transcriptional regulator, partial [Acidimicrobiales bacterium]